MYRVKVSLALNVNIETIDDLVKILNENGYSKRAIAQIVKWYG
jgi:predicted Ser/Thr protein kinase